MSRAASILKDQGNAAFKANSYSLAIEHYTAAIKSDPSDAILPCNRAMAYLKLKQWREAARDATRSLDLQPTGNGKALFRRGVARKGLGDFAAACEDFEAVLAHDSNNKSALTELQEIKALLVTKARTTSKAEPSVPRSHLVSIAAPPSASASGFWPSTRTNKFKAALETPLPAISLPDADLLRKVYTTRYTKGSSSQASPQIPSDQVAARELSQSFANVKANSSDSAMRIGFADLKKVREDRQAAKSSVSIVSSTLTTQTHETGPLGQGLITRFGDFERRWGVAWTRESKWEVLKALDRDAVPRIFGDHLEPEQLETILNVVTTSATSDGPSAEGVALGVLEALSKVPRLNLLTMFLNITTQEGLVQVLSRLLSSNARLATEISDKFGLRL